MIVNINQNNYNEYVSNNNNLIILDFFTKQCAPCKILDTTLKEIDDQNQNITICKVDIEEQIDIAINFGIMSVPSIIILKNNNVLKKISGLKDKDFIQNLINTL